MLGRGLSVVTLVGRNDWDLPATKLVGRGVFFDRSRVGTTGEEAVPKGAGNRGLPAKALRPAVSILLARLWAR